MTNACRYIFSIASAVLLCLAPSPDLFSQGAGDDSVEEMRLALSVKEKIQSFTQEMESLCATVQKASPEVYQDLLRSYNSLHLRWETYYQSYQNFIADHDDLMQAVSDYGMADESLSAGMEVFKQRLDAVLAFDAAMEFLGSRDSLYTSLYNQSLALSASPRLAGELEKLKGKEKICFEEIQKRYDEAASAVELLPEKKKEMERLEEKYIALGCISEKIQQAAYKPLIQRVKDYLLGLATVAVILMFISMVRSKLQAAKQLRENARKMLENLKGKDDDLPTI